MCQSIIGCVSDAVLLQIIRNYFNVNFEVNHKFEWTAKLKRNETAIIKLFFCSKGDGVNTRARKACLRARVKVHWADSTEIRFFRYAINIKM